MLDSVAVGSSVASSTTLSDGADASSFGFSSGSVAAVSAAPALAGPFLPFCFFNCS
jgi:hypothetical protein